MSSHQNIPPALSSNNPPHQLFSSQNLRQNIHYIASPNFPQNNLSFNNPPPPISIPPQNLSQASYLSHFNSPPINSIQSLNQPLNDSNPALPINNYNGSEFSLDNFAETKIGIDNEEYPKTISKF